MEKKSFLSGSNITDLYLPGSDSDTLSNPALNTADSGSIGKQAAAEALGQGQPGVTELWAARIALRNAP